MCDICSMILIKELRIRRGLSQNQLGRLVGVTGSAISAIERGYTKEPRWRLVTAIAKELRVGARTLFATEKYAVGSRRGKGAV